MGKHPRDLPVTPGRYPRWKSDNNQTGHLQGCLHWRLESTQNGYIYTVHGQKGDDVPVTSPYINRKSSGPLTKRLIDSVPALESMTIQ